MIGRPSDAPKLMEAKEWRRSCRRAVVAHHHGFATFGNGLLTASVAGPFIEPSSLRQLPTAVSDRRARRGQGLGFAALLGPLFARDDVWVARHARNIFQDRERRRR